MVTALIELQKKEEEILTKLNVNPPFIKSCNRSNLQWFDTNEQVIYTDDQCHTDSSQSAVL